MGIEFFQTGWLRRLMLAVSLMIAAPLGFTACASSSYAGIPFASGAADPELQGLAQRAQAGDKRAQLELGIRYEEGRGVPVDLGRAERLYRGASGGERLSRSYSVPSGLSGRLLIGTLYYGDETGGLPAAHIRLCRLDHLEGHDPGCGSTDDLSEVLILASYDMNFRQCAERVDYLAPAVTHYRDLRYCLIQSINTIECEEELQESLGKITALFAQRSELSHHSDGMEILESICGYPPTTPPTVELPISPGRPGYYVTPIDIAFEPSRMRHNLRRNLIFDADDFIFGEYYIRAFYNAASFLFGSICRLRSRNLGFMLSTAEEELCEIVKEGERDDE